MLKCQQLLAVSFMINATSETRKVIIIGILIFMSYSNFMFIGVEQEKFYNLETRL